MLPIWRTSQQDDINFVPEETRAYRAKAQRVYIAIFSASIIFFELLIFATVSFFKLKEEKTKTSLASQVEQLNAEWQKQSGKAAALNTIKINLSTYKTFSAADPLLSEKIFKIIEIVPSGVTLTDLMIDSSGGVELRGNSRRPNDLYQMMNAVQAKSDTFSSVDLSSFAGGSDTEYTFSLSFVVK